MIYMQSMHNMGVQFKIHRQGIVFLKITILKRQKEMGKTSNIL